MTKKVVLVDFDGTLNSYRSGFEPNAPEHLPDGPNPGAIAWLRRVVASGQYEPVIFTTRVYDERTDDDREIVKSSIRGWLVRHGLEQVVATSIQITSRKIKCSLIVDDNAWRFEGTWPSPAEMSLLTGGRR